ncbi:MAG: FAD:protein FMN transferase, partial [Odoribacter sp.]|nr:FAD:protein FMN transferase [Odoribacter sp.]
KNTLENVIVSKDNSSIFYQRKNIVLDFSGYAKGYGLDRIKEILKENGIKDALINMGNSSVMAMGNQPGGKGWKIGYHENHTNNNQYVILQDECLSTSGNDTEERKHIYNPIGKKYKEGKNRISVMTSTGTEGEVFSTALFAASDEIREKLSATYGVKIYYH